jgi:succinyl-CoA synthetase beta subunit
MHIHEYQAKILLKRFGVPVPAFVVASNMQEVKEGIEQLKLKEAVIKIQVHAGGRGKAGGVKFAKNPSEIELFSQKLIGMKMVNNQTGPQGLISHKILISAPLAIKREFYLAAVIDRNAAAAMLIISKEGGMEIEEIAVKRPESILKVKMGNQGQISDLEVAKILKFLDWGPHLEKEGADLIRNFCKAFISSDSSLLEINPLVETEEGHLFALDAKCTIDDNALFRQEEIASWFDATQLPQAEVLAAEHDLAYVALSGEIGCMVNGAGLAMATMDIIHNHGGTPANFLDVGGSATKEKIAQGFKIIMLDPNVKAIFVNIFGGIMDCGVLASGIVAATQEDGMVLPLIVRMEGTNVDMGKKILKDSGLAIMIAETMEEGAKKAVAAAKG